MALLIIFSYIIVIVWQGPKMLQKKLWKEFAVFVIFLSLGFIYSIGIIYNWPLPNPAKRIEYMLEPISKFVEETLS